MLALQYIVLERMLNATVSVFPVMVCEALDRYCYVWDVAAKCQSQTLITVMCGLKFSCR